MSQNDTIQRSAATGDRSRYADDGSLDDALTGLGVDADPSASGGPGASGNGAGNGVGGSGNGSGSTPAKPAADTEKRRNPATARGWQDVLFRSLARSAGAVVLGIMGLVGLFLVVRGSEAIGSAGPSFLTEQSWEPNSGTFGIAAVLFGTVTIALIAIVVAIPLALGSATYISEYAPRNIKGFLTGIVDLMAAIPSVVYGLWGVFWLEANVLPVSQWISTFFGWIPIFAVEDFDANNPLATPTVFTASALLAGLVVAMMVAPIASSIMREVFSQAPLGEREGALALGSTKWGMIRSVVYPFGTGGIIGGTMLGLGRALGETIAVYLVISPVFIIQPNILATGTNSISALVALRYGEASPFELSALMAAGLVLFIITMIVNFGASIIISRSRSGASSEA
ncbi:phosphate ABC transporter membrane protein 1 (PhoT family) [Glaciihabitans tibetensis]|uniref:Phosphate transport system permease protein n=1 Tax=Glaciihabitans tibetensis TaxID=1266600 RepID=A0A2T0VCP3_9MICO|nr:phosphate ABC transporter permease subunit PstC [Glaciihabitans tibetensis]PRY67939.1 phosphate ABC transporter membrane protein 1 (PhoT family) [Glaciihabitans tibetensis]